MKRHKKLDLAMHTVIVQDVNERFLVYDAMCFGTRFILFRLGCGSRANPTNAQLIYGLSF
jgi:hypothetical protein